MPADCPSSLSGHSEPEQRSGNGPRYISAALLAALFQALGQCQPDQRVSILSALESRLGGVDDLAAKLESLLAVGTSDRDRIQGLWLLYLDLIAQDLGDTQIWIGPDVFSDDVASHLRLHLPEGGASAFRSGLSGELEILAQTVHSTARVTLRRPAPEQIVVMLRDATSLT